MIASPGDLLSIRCMGCGKRFTWLCMDLHETPRAHHSAKCAYRTNTRRRASALTCPRPEKAVWATEQAASLRVKRWADQGQFLSTYRCVCGNLHIGNVDYTVVSYGEALVNDLVVAA